MAHKTVLGWVCSFLLPRYALDTADRLPSPVPLESGLLCLLQCSAFQPWLLSFMAKAPSLSLWPWVFTFPDSVFILGHYLLAYLKEGGASFEFSASFEISAMPQTYEQFVVRKLSGTPDIPEENSKTFQVSNALKIRGLNQEERFMQTKRL